MNTKDIKKQLIVMKHVANVYAGVFLTGNHDNHNVGRFKKKFQINQFSILKPFLKGDQNNRK